MTVAECRKLEKGTRILAGPEFMEGADPDVEPWLGKVVTFSEFKNDKWVYFYEMPSSPLHYKEIECIVQQACIDNPTIPYQFGDMSLIFGEVLT